MKRKSAILFCLAAMLLAVIFIINKRIESEKLKVTNEKTEEDRKKENKTIKEIEASTTQDNFKDRNIEYSRPTAQAGAAILNINQAVKTVDIQSNNNEVISKQDKKNYFLVTKVVDGDTIDVYPVKSSEVGAEQFNGISTGTTTERVRLIGVNTPEVVDPRKPVECFGREASAQAHELLENKKVYLEADETQDNRDKYGRLLRYAWREDGLFYNLEIIKQGYAYEYTYFIPYKYQADFKAAENYARENKLGLWADSACNKETEVSLQKTNQNCNIKGNINSKGEKIYHLPTCEYYAKTVINLDQGEKYFCTESEAQAAGWRKAQNCE